MIINDSNTTVAVPSKTANSDGMLTTQLYRPARYFFVGMSILFLIISVVGFVPSYQAMYNGRRFPIHWFAHVHGALMTIWLLVFIAQTILAAKGHLKFHRQLGLFSVGLGVLIWVSMWIASALALIGFNPPVDHYLFDVLIIQLYSIVLFGLFFTWGILERKHGAAHKRLLLLSTLVLIQAAIDRINWLPGLHMALYVRFIYLDALLIPLFIYDWLILGRIHKITWVGTSLYIVSQVIVTEAWGSIAWHNFWFNLMNKFQ